MRIEGLSRCPCLPLSLGLAQLSLQGEGEAGPALAHRARGLCELCVPDPSPQSQAPAGPGSQLGHCTLFNPSQHSCLSPTDLFTSHPGQPGQREGSLFVTPTSSVAVLTSVSDLTHLSNRI